MVKAKNPTTGRKWLAGNGGRRVEGFVQNLKNLMAVSFVYRCRTLISSLVVLALPAIVSGQGNYVAEGGEYKAAGTLAGDQIEAQLSIKTTGGYLVWRDNITDGDGYGISARKLDGSLTGVMSTFRVNEAGDLDQERPQVSILKSGGAVFVWQGGPQGFQHIYGRVLAADGTWLTGDIAVSAATNVNQMDVATATLTNGNVVAVWSSYNQAAAGSMQDIYAQILTPTGGKFGPETRLNQTTIYNQKSAAIAPLSDGRFVVVWISEQQRYENSVDVYGRIFNALGTPATEEFLINSGTNVCANPTVAASNDGGFAAAWTEMDLDSISNRWDVFARPFSATAIGGVTRRINTYTIGDQVGPKLSSLGSDYFVVWTSVGQDGYREGIYAQGLRGDGTPVGEELRVNTTTISQQISPAVAADGVSRFMAVWSGFVGGGNSLDLFAQRYVNTNQPLNAPGAPIVNVLDTARLALTWPAVSGFTISNYEVYADGAATATSVTTNTFWTMSGLTAGSTHSFRLAYVLGDGRRSPLSPSATATTYLYPFTHGGIPYDWMFQMWGSETGSWPAATVDSDGDGISNLQEFLQGTDPKNASSALRYRLRSTGQGVFLDWNTQPGLMYQVQFSASAGGLWIDFGGPRFAAGTNDSLYVGGSNSGFYRIGRVR